MQTKKNEMLEPYSINIICIGSWNKKIFTPNWVTSNLFGLPAGKEFKGVFNPEELEFGFMDRDILLIPKENSIEIKLEVINDDTKIYAVEMFNKILALLPQTPIKATGVNIRFEIAFDDKYPIITTLKNSNCSYENFTLKQAKLVKNVDNYEVNLITDILEDRYQINFNFHYKDKIVLHNQVINKHLEDSIKVITYGNI